MSIRDYLASICVGLLLSPTFAGASWALTMQECSTKYKAAQAEGTLKGKKWNDFRKSDCGTDVAPAARGAAAKGTTTQAPDQVGASASPARSASGLGGSPVFPTAISPKYASQSAGKARMHSCLDQYNANKANGGNGGLKWTQKGGGYYSECNRRLSSR